MKGKLILFIFCLIVWSLLSRKPFDLQNLIVGAAVAAFVAFFTGDIFIRKAAHAKKAIRFLWLAYYIPMLLWEWSKANVDLMYRILEPVVAANPGIIKIKTTLKSDTGLTFLANSITLASGTFCVDIDAHGGALYIHWLDVKSQDTEKAAQLIAFKFEKILKRIFE